MSATNSQENESLITSVIEGAQIRRGASGTWFVQDFSERRGGYFRDWEAAIAFIRQEFNATGRTS